MKKIPNFGNKKILVVGDTIIDIYTYSSVVCEALYAQIPETEEIRSSVSFGGNSLIASNILELGGTVTLVSVLGSDTAARHYDTFVHPQLRKIFVTDPSRKTTVKQRWFADGKPVLQVNSVSNHDLEPSLERKVRTILKKEIEQADVVVVMDPQHGFLTRRVISDILAFSKEYNKPLYVDVQISHRKSRHTHYKGADTFFLNSREAVACYKDFYTDEPEHALQQILKKLKANNVIVKLGEEGSVAFLNGKYIKTDAYKVTAVDVCGAGDSFLAAFSMCDTSEPNDALTIANTWGGLSTMVHGTVPPKKRDLVRALKMRRGNK